MANDHPHPTTTQPLTVARLAALAGVTVRTLHHYDRIGLVEPSARSDADYRLYEARDVARLREVLVWRRLGVPLAEIRALLDDPQVGRDDVLRRQRLLVDERIAELRDLASALDDALRNPDGHDEEHDMTTDQAIIDALGGFDPADHEAEARERWGDTDAYLQSAARARTYGPDEWRRIKADVDAITERLADLWAAEARADGEAAIEQAEAFRAHVSRWFYDCPPELLRGLGDMYVADPRFTASYDGADGERAGLAAWIRDAWHALADRG